MLRLIYDILSKLRHDAQGTYLALLQFLLQICLVLLTVDDAHSEMQVFFRGYLINDVHHELDVLITACAARGAYDQRDVRAERRLQQQSHIPLGAAPCNKGGAAAQIIRSGINGACVAANHVRLQFHCSAQGILREAVAQNTRCGTYFIFFHIFSSWIKI